MRKKIIIRYISILLLISGLITPTLASTKKDQTKKGESTVSEQPIKIELNKAKAAKSINEIQFFANDDILYIYENTISYSPVLNNDYSSIGFEKVSMTIIKQASHGSSEVSSDKTIKYTPEYRFVGKDEIGYRICLNNQCVDATLFIEIADWDYKPEAVNDEKVIIKGTNETIGILNNDLNLSDEPIQLTILQNTTNNECVINNDHTITTQFDDHFIGSDTLTYQICDAEGDCSTAQVYFLVTTDGKMDFFIPTGLSPNGDGLNDLFIIPEFQYYTHVEMRIINRRGELVVEDKNYQNNWDGKGNVGSYANKLLPSDTYYYLFNVSGISQPLTGYIYINK